MSRALLSALALSAALVVQALPGAPAAAESAEWPALAKAFGENFKTKQGVSLEQKRKAVNALAKSNDGRAVDLLIGVVDDQQKYAGKLLKEWEEGEAAWQEKTRKLDAQLQELQRQAKERGDETLSVPMELAEWFGLTAELKDKPKSLEVKKQLAEKYARVQEEMDLPLAILRAASRVLNSLGGEELERASAKVITAAQGAKDERKAVFVRALGYAKGEKVLTFLESMTKDPNVSLVQLALESIGRQNSERGADVLIGRLDDARWQVRASAITGLAYYRNGAVVGKVMDALLERAKKEDGVLQRNFFVGMAKIVQESIPGTVEAWESWWKANREAFVKKATEREGNGLPLEEEPKDQLIETQQGSSSFYGITTTSKHIIFVVDVSGSMGFDAKDGKIEKPPPGATTRIMIARAELKKALQGLTSKDGDERGEASFNIVIFSSDVEVYKPGKMIDATKANKEDALKWIDEHVVALGATNIFDAIERAFDVISATSDAKNLKRGADTIFLMTDGKANRGRFVDNDLIVAEVKKMNATRKLTLHTIGVGDDHNPELLSALAATNGGQYLGR